MTEPLLEVEGLDVTYPSRGGAVRAARDVSFALGRERLAIVGESGSGKSTTGRAILGLIPPPGVVRARRLAFDGIDLGALTDAGWSRLRGRRLAMVMQDPKFALNPVLRVGSQIMQTYRLHRRASRREAEQRALEMLESVRIRDPETVFRLYPHQLSGGMGQRVMIAMMLIGEPDLLIADEPTSALDVTVQNQVLRVLDDLVVARGMGLIFITHNLTLVSSFCDRALVMYAGRVVEQCDARRLQRGASSLYPSVGRRRAGPRSSARRAAHSGARPVVGGVTAAPAIAVERLEVTFTHEGRRIDAVCGVSFAVAPGETFGLVGESGSGKSTVLKTIAGLVAPTAGGVRLDGRAMTAKRDRAERRRLQYVFQDPYGSLHPRHTVDRALREPLEIHGVADRDAVILAALADVGLDPRHRFRYPHQLSGGQRQRVAIARALILSPGALLLDEPTSSLDVSVQAEILNLLTRVRRERALTTIFVSHDLAVVAHLCERVAIMRLGEIVETLPIETLRLNGAATPYGRELMAASRGYVRHGEPLASVRESEG